VVGGSAAAGSNSSAGAAGSFEGSGSGSFAAGKVVTISANPPPANQHFVKWIGDVAALDDASKASAILTMPKAYVSLRATYAP